MLMKTKSTLQAPAEAALEGSRLTVDEAVALALES